VNCGKKSACHDAACCGPEYLYKTAQAKETNLPDRFLKIP